jgi:hypothetical protein
MWVQNTETTKAVFGAKTCPLQNQQQYGGILHISIYTMNINVNNIFFLNHVTGHNVYRDNIWTCWGAIYRREIDHFSDGSQALEFRTPLFSHLVPPAIMVWIFVWEYISEPFIHILQHFVLQLSRYTNFCF